MGGEIDLGEIQWHAYGI